MAESSFLRFFSWKRLRVQVIAVCILTLTVALGGVTTTFINQHKETLSKEYLHEASILAKHLSRSVLEWILNEDYDKLSETAERTAEFSRVTSIWVYDPEGFLICAARKGDTGEIEEVFSLDKVEVPGDGFSQSIHDDTITTWVAIESEDRIGWVRLITSMDDLNSMNAALWKQGVSFLAVFLLLSTLVFWRFFDGPLKAIEQITDYASRMTG